MDPFVHQQFEHLHSIPEIGLHEEKTSAYLADQLEKLGFKVTRNVGTTGVVGELDSGKPGPAFAIRADFDALPYVIDGKNVAIHACGHDANSSMALTAMKRASERGIKSGKLIMVCQQGEEVMGAIEMSQSPKLPHIDKMVAMHLRPTQEAVLGEAISALSTSATFFITMKVRGVVAHGARPFLGVNPIDIACAIVDSVAKIQENASKRYSVKVTQLRSEENAKNSLPSSCDITFDVRSAEQDAADSIIEKVRKLSNGIAEAYGGAIEDFQYHGVLAAVLDDELEKLNAQAITDVLGPGSCKGKYTSTGGEDIHYFHKYKGIPIGYIGLGANVEYGLHHPKMCFDHSALDIGADILTRVIDLNLGLGSDQNKNQGE